MDFFLGFIIGSGFMTVLLTIFYRDLCKKYPTKAVDNQENVV